MSGYEWPLPQYDALAEGHDLATSDISSVGNSEVRVGPDSMVAVEWLCFVS